MDEIEYIYALECAITPDRVNTVGYYFEKPHATKVAARLMKELGVDITIIRIRMNTLSIDEEIITHSQLAV